MANPERALERAIIVVLLTAPAVPSAANAQEEAPGEVELAPVQNDVGDALDPREAPTVEPNGSKGGPEILLAPGEPMPEETQAGEYGLDFDPLRGMQEARLSRKTSVGGYGELHLNLFKNDDDPARAVLDLHRLVLFIAHNFNDRLRFYTELELEHALVATAGGVAIPGSFGVEQAFIDWRILTGTSEALYFRGGAILVPMGIINQWHEPPIFHGVERPLVDRVIIPTTWREGGVGVWGEPIEGLRYEFYVMSGLDASGFTGANGLRGGRLPHPSHAQRSGLHGAAGMGADPRDGGWDRALLRSRRTA